MQGGYEKLVSVIVVDDDRDTVEIFSEFLKIHGIEVVGIGHNGKDAVELFKELKPDLTLLDMKMPEYDGKYAIDEIKKINPSAKIIVVTGYTEYHKNELDVSALFYKPYEINDILKKIKELVDND